METWHGDMAWRHDMETEGANAGRDGRNCFARPNHQARTGTHEKIDFIFPVQLTMTSRIDIDSPFYPVHGIPYHGIPSCYDVY